MIEIQIDHKKLRKTERLLINLGETANRPTKALKQIGEVMVTSVQKNFASEGRPERWASLSLMTLAMRRNKNKSSVKILQDTGMLKNSITYALRNDDTELAIGTNVVYAKIHQEGGKINIPARTIVPKKAKVLRFTINGKVVFAKSVHQKARTAIVPQRKFLMFQEEDKEDIRSILIENLLKNEDNSD